VPPSSQLRQPPINVPIVTSRSPDPVVLGMIGLRSRVFLQLETTFTSQATSVPFVVDSGASYSIMSLALAEESSIRVPPFEAELQLPLQTVSGSISMRVRPGRIRGWWHPERTGYPFDWPVLFRVDAPPSVPSILGLGGVVKTCQWLFDGTYSPESPYGSLTLHDTR